VLQAIAAGRPVIGLQSGENKTLLSSGNHILLRPTSSDALIAGLRDTLLTMASEDSRHQVSAASHKTVQHSQQLLTWDERATRYLADYVAILRSAPRPNLSSGSLNIAGGD
jgi:glycosyltransferase involved in cell wall biosynthesis